MVGIISGTVVLTRWRALKSAKKIRKTNSFGTSDLLLSGNIAFLPRHGLNADRHILPHLINHRANIQALKDVGVSQIIGINSAGSLKQNINPGRIVIPHDFIMPSPYNSFFSDTPGHITPELNGHVRNLCIKAADDINVDVINGGTYWQTTGPRLETKAEIKMMSAFAELVGMTMAGEAIAAAELGMPFASICSVDNYANGLAVEKLSMEKISNRAKQNAKTIIMIITRYIQNLDERI